MRTWIALRVSRQPGQRTLATINRRASSKHVVLVVHHVLVDGGGGLRGGLLLSLLALLGRGGLELVVDDDVERGGEVLDVFGLDVDGRLPEHLLQEGRVESARLSAERIVR